MTNKNDAQVTGKDATLMNRWINRLDIPSMVSGLLVGLLIGMVLIGSNDGLRDSLFGAGVDGDNNTNSDVKDYAYYLVELPSAQEWLAEKYPEKSEDLKQALGVIQKLPSAADFHEEFKSAEKDVETVLPEVYAALANSEAASDEKEEYDPARDILTCLGMDDDPYGVESIMYLYVTIPRDKIASIEIPENWDELGKPKSNELYWQLLACYPDLKS